MNFALPRSFKSFFPVFSSIILIICCTFLQIPVYAQQQKNKPAPAQPTNPEAKIIKPADGLSDPGSEAAQYRATLPEKPAPVQVEKVYTAVEVMAEPGYNVAQYINKNIKYPESELRSRTQGAVLVQFVVGKTGKIRDAVIKKSLSPECDAEALRVIKAMPDWKKPGMQNGVAIHTYYSVPVAFYIK